MLPGRYVTPPVTSRPSIGRIRHVIQSAGCVLSPILYTLFTHDCVASHKDNIIVKFADDTAVIGRITGRDEAAYRREVASLVTWCEDNNLTLNTDKTKEMIVDMKKERRTHQPLFIRELEVERVSSFKYLGVHISEDLTWTLNTTQLVKKAQQRLYFLRRLRKFGMSPKILSNFYSCVVESVLTSCITVWYGSTTVRDRKRLQRVVRTAEKIIRTTLPSLQTIYHRRVHRRAASILKDPNHPQHGLFTLLPSGRRTALWRKADQLLVCFGPPKRGFPASKQTLSRWIVESISLAFESSGLPSPLGVKAHSTRAVAASKAFWQACLVLEAGTCKSGGVGILVPIAFRDAARVPEGERLQVTDGQRELHCVFVDLEKAYDRVPREELWYCMRKSGVAEKYVRVVQDMYERSRTVVRCAVGQTEEFTVEVGLHQGSALSPFLFAMVMDQSSEEVRQESPCTVMFADDIVIYSESREQVEENLERWRFVLERRGMKVSRSKTEYMCVNEREGSGTVRLQGEEVKEVQEFKYLGSTVQSNGECGKESGVAEKYVRVVQDMYERSRTVVRCAVGQTEEFKVEVGLHQGSALSPFLFAMVMDQLSEEDRQESPCTMMFADDIVICSESREQVEENLEKWRFALERRGMRVSRSKTEYMCVNEREGSGTVRLQGEEVKKVQEFKYLGSTVQSNGECGKEVKKRVQAGWNG
ncbi:hypothetical protein PGIGA_G00051260 [Pangasianodon gigas]|uniref:Uncharacterized protein n=1 Tax=Pangasianodon gigas TaxID=30993 RepID=A0ACC5X2F2_PANGG|nr:hypothetical protein [Pangasianodon gigas]